MSIQSEHETNTEKLKRRNRELSILNTIAEALNREVDLSEALRVVLAQVADLCGLRTGWIWLLNEDPEGIYLAAVQNLPPAVSNTPGLMDGTAYCHCLDTYISGDMSGAANINIVTCTRMKKLAHGAEGLRYHASIPLYAHDKKLGVLNVASADWRELSSDDLRLLHTVGDLLSMAIERARLFDQSTQVGATEERNRLAREIHDTLAQGLAAITLQLETADALLETGTDTQKVRSIVQHALELTRGNLEEARRSVLDLRAAPLEGRTLNEALEALVTENAARSDVSLRFKSGEKRSLPVRIETGLYRIAQEALANALRHANAQNIILQLTTLPDEVELDIEDDGCGFDISESMEGHFGLVGMNERARLMGGNLIVCSHPNVGTKIQVSIPLKAK